MLGAIFGDIVGSRFEGQNLRRDSFKGKDFSLFSPDSRFTDDTVCTVAVAESLLHNKPLAPTLQRWGRLHLNAGFGGRFFEWLHDPDPKPYGSWGNGSAMRASPVGWVLSNVDSTAEILALAARSAECTHDSPEGIYGAQAVALAIYHARLGESAEDLRHMLHSFFPEYELDRKIDDIRPTYKFDVSCQGSVPEAILCALEASSVEEAVRLAVSLGGDSDTQACIAGSIAEARFGFPPELIPEVMSRIPEKMQRVVKDFAKKFMALELP